MKKNKRTINLKSIQNKINALGKDPSLKFALQLQLISGLRIAEIANLRYSDIILHDNYNFDLFVRAGKGNVSRVVNCKNDILDTKQVYAKLCKIKLKNADVEDKIFNYAYNTIKHKALDLGIATHDLRRIFAYKYFNSLQNNGLSKDGSMEKTKEQMGHKSILTTKLYLNHKFL